MVHRLLSIVLALSSNGLGRSPLKAEIRVRFPLRLPTPAPRRGFWFDGRPVLPTPLLVISIRDPGPAPEEPAVRDVPEKEQARSAAIRTGARSVCVRPRGVEPLTYRSVVCRSIQLSYGRVNMQT